VTQTYAFFDVDDTLVRLKTMFSYQDFYYRNVGVLSRLVGPRRLARFEATRRSYVESGRPREDLNRMYYQTFRGRRPETVASVAWAWYRHVQARPDGLYFPAVLRALRQHQDEGHEIIFISGSMVDILRPIADELKADHLLATRLVARNGRYTGEIIPPQTIGEGKAEAVRSFLAARENDGRNCWAYGDDRSDVPMLSLAGHPVVVSSAATMVNEARSRGWRTLDPEVGDPRGQA
jgi:HAD superfamily hydrolase (TIGR01490 family)